MGAGSRFRAISQPASNPTSCRFWVFDAVVLSLCPIGNLHVAGTYYCILSLPWRTVVPSCDVAWVGCGGCLEGLNQGYCEEKHFPRSVQCPHCIGWLGAAAGAALEASSWHWDRAGLLVWAVLNNGMGRSLMKHWWYSGRPKGGCWWPCDEKKEEGLWRFFLNTNFTLYQIQNKRVVKFPLSWILATAYLNNGPAGFVCLGWWFVLLRCCSLATYVMYWMLLECGPVLESFQHSIIGKSCSGVWLNESPAFWYYKNSDLSSVFEMYFVAA